MRRLHPADTWIFSIGQKLHEMTMCNGLAKSPLTRLARFLTEVVKADWSRIHGIYNWLLTKYQKISTMFFLVTDLDYYLLLSRCSLRKYYYLKLF